MKTIGPKYWIPIIVGVGISFSEKHVISSIYFIYELMVSAQAGQHHFIAWLLGVVGFSLCRLQGCFFFLYLFLIAWAAYSLFELLRELRVAGKPQGE